jgi:diketogulonate reductase-like aldo/keto reductase
MGYNETLEAFERTLKNLDTDYLDLSLIHWPRYTLDGEWRQTCIDSWKAMEELYEAGRVRAIGLSNFLPHHMDVILDNCRIKPMVNQLEVHPGYTQEAAIRYCQEHNILVQAWSPLGRQRVLNEPLLVELAEKYNVTPAQICLRWCLQHNTLPLPKSVTHSRILENADIFDFILSDEDMMAIDAVPFCGGSGHDSDNIDF